MAEVVQGLWIGGELSVMEQLSISSFLAHGHEYHLYTYGEVKHVPGGTVIRDGAEILPASMIFRYRVKKSYSGFSNLFRYKLLFENGGWWVDTDVVCLRPFDFSSTYVYATERCREEVVATTCVIKAPAASPVMRHAFEVSDLKDPARLVWGEIGPKLMAEAVRRFSLQDYAQPSEVFCPLDPDEWHRVLAPDPSLTFGETTRAVHLWNEMWRRVDLDKDREYPSGCLYERLKARYLWNGPEKRDQERRDNEPGNGKEVQLSRRRFTKEFKLAAVRRLEAGESGSALARELEVKREKLYDWLAQVERYGVEGAFPGAGRRPGGSARVEPGREAQARLAELERKVGRQAMEIDFLSAALRRVEDLRRPSIVSGTGASLTKYEPQGGKAT